MYNSWKMRCVDVSVYNELYTAGKIYEVVNGKVVLDIGITYGPYKSFDDWGHHTTAKWELVEDEMTIQEKIAKAEAKIAKWQGKMDALKQQEQEQKVDWNKVPAGTPVLCWFGNDVPDGYESKRLFLAEAMGKLWSLDIGNKNRAEAWEHMKLADFDKSEK